MRRMLTTMIVLAAASAAVFTQAPTPARPASPSGTAAIQVGDWKPADTPAVRARTGKWIEVTYGRPIKRGRESLFGAGADYGKAVTDGAPVWRAGANASTRFKTDVPLAFGATTVPAGEYLLFVDLKGPAAWTLILSTHTPQTTYDPNDKTKLWGAVGYTPDKDVLRVPMKVETLPYSVEQLTFVFTDATGAGATLRLMWDTVMASVAFTVAK